MIANAFFIATVLLLALGLYLMGECRFLIPYKSLLFGPYLQPITLFVAALFLNLFAVIYLITRRLLLKDTGRKLAHLEKQLRAGQLSEELSRRLEE